MGHITKDSSDSKEQFYPEYTYEEILSQDQLIGLQDDFCRLKDSCYLDHGGASLYAKSQLESAMNELHGNLFSNPHSRNPSSSITTDATDHVRQRILQHFGTSEDEYTVIFTSGATGALKLLAESFSYDGGMFAYLEDNHTSVVGMREYLLKNRSFASNYHDDITAERVHCISKLAMEKLMNPPTIPPTSNLTINADQLFTKNSLMAFPAQCNFSGFKYPLDWVTKIHHGYLNPITTLNEFYIEEENVQMTTSQPIIDSTHKWYVVLDAASYVASNKLDLSLNRPDFVAVSFYKMFGWPTGIGALLVRNNSGDVLRNKQYFGGGTVNISLPSHPFHVKRSKLYERFEDGTISFLEILGIRHGLNALTKYFSNMDSITLRTFRLTQYLYRNLNSMKYFDGQKVAKIYSDTIYDTELTQGPVVTFNLLRPNGDIIGYSEMEQIAYLHNVNLRYGCFCNPGACRRHLGLKPEQVLKHFEAGHVCGDMRDIIDGVPTGAIRVSIGYMTTRENIDLLLGLIFNCWIKPSNINQTSIVSFDTMSLKQPEGEGRRMKLSKIFVYPIKSCAPFEVKQTWTIGPHGLLYDREWLIVSSSNVPLTAKREPRLCLIEPMIDISNRQLVLHFHGDDVENDMHIPLDLNSSFPTVVEAPLCNSKVCGDSIVGIDCGDRVSNWLCRVFDKTDLRLIRLSPNHHRKPKLSLEEISLANQSQFLLLSLTSLRHLARELISNKLLSSLNIHPDTSTTNTEETVIDSLIGRFRGNLVIDAECDHKPYEEETWTGIRIGATHFKSGGPCIRCATICMDPITGAKSSEPLLTLSRSRGCRPNFGVHLYTCTQPPPTKNNDNIRPPIFLQTLRIGDNCQPTTPQPDNNNKENENVQSFSKAFEEIRNID